MEKTRKISMIPEFLQNRKTYVLTAIVVTIIGVLSLSFAYFNSQNANGNLDNTIVVSTLNSGEVITTFDHSDGIIKITNEEFNSDEESITKILKFAITNNGDINKNISINWSDLTNQTCDYISNNECTNDNTDDYVGDNLKYYLYSCPLNSYNAATINYDYNSNCELISDAYNNVPNTGYEGKIQAAKMILINAESTKYYVLKAETSINDYDKYARFFSRVVITDPSYEVNDINIFALTIDGTSANSLPDNKYHELTSYTCLIDDINYDENDNILEYDTFNRTLKIVDKVTDNVFCTLNFTTCDIFEAKAHTYQSTNMLGYKILSDSNVDKSTLPPTLSKAAVSQEFMTANGLSTDDYVVENGIYQTEDDDGTTYFYRGHVERNYVKFAGFIWRIVRINGDGSIRIVLDGVTSTVKKDDPANTLCTTGCAGSNAQYNNDSYDAGEPSVSNEATAIEYASYDNGNLEGAINTFYETYIYNEANNIDYRDYLEDSIFCSDTSWGNPKEVYDYWYFASYTRILNGISTLRCGTDYQYKVLNGGVALTYPIATMSADEINYVGGQLSISNQNYYLYNNVTTNERWLTMSTFHWRSYGPVLIFSIYNDGNLNENFPHYVTAVRPVVNLKADTPITSGMGTSDQPYQVGQ